MEPITPILSEKIASVCIKIGQTAIKAIIQIWLRKKKSKYSNNIIEAFEEIESDAITKQKAAHQFEKISILVTDQIAALFKSDGAELEESSRAAVAHAVFESLSRRPISAELLIDLNLQPSSLLAHLEDPELQRDFDSKEVALYRAVLSFCTQFINDSASKLPSFTEKAVGELLVRDAYILNRIEIVLQNVKRIHDAIPSTNPDAAKLQFEREYRLAVVRRMDEVELFGVDVSFSSRKQRLSVAYVALSLKPQLESNQVQSTSDEQEVQFAIDPYISPTDILRRSRSIIIRGHAGSGKTTLLQWFAVKIASRELDDDLEALNDRIPVFIKLREFSQAPLPQPEQFAALVAPEIAATMPVGWMHEQIKSGRIMLLIDGLDELPSLGRRQLYTWLKAIRQQNTDITYIITSRPPAIDEEWASSESLEIAELQPMDLNSTDEFIQHWHDAVREGVSAEQKDELKSLSENLKEVIRTSGAIRSLASTPLLCAMLCALHRDRHRRLPSDRIELYKACCDALIDRRDPERSIKFHEYPDLTLRQKMSLLQDVAYWFIKNGWTEIEKSQFELRISLRMPGLSLLPSTTAQSIRKLLVERSGVLREPTTGRIDFIHRTFQEFLAAQASVDEDDVGLLVEHANNDQWHETILLAAGLAPRRVAEQLVRGLVERGDKDKGVRHQLHFLSVACLETAVDLSPDTRAQVEQRLKKLVPPKNMTEAKAISAAGDLAAPLLESNKNLLAVEAAACVRALSIIQTARALKAIETYAGDRRQTVQVEMIRAWDFFPNTDYPKRILKNIDSISLELRNSDAIEDIIEIPQLKNIEINIKSSSDLGTEVLTPLSSQHDLTQVRLCTETDISNQNFHPISVRFIANLPNLEFLNITGPLNIDTIPLLSRPEKMVAVELESINISNVNFLGDCSALNRLKLRGLGELLGLEPLSRINHHHLYALEVSRCAGIFKLEWLEKMSRLRELTLKDISTIGDAMELLGGLQFLTVLNLNLTNKNPNLKPADLLFAKNLHSLNELHLDDFSNLENLSGLESSRHLRYLRIHGSPLLSSIKHVSENSSLYLLSFSSIASGIDLSHLPKKLAYLDLGDIDASVDLSPLLSLQKMKRLVLHRHSAKDAQTIDALKARGVRVVFSSSRLKEAVHSD